jgi:hypothetical protein
VIGDDDTRRTVLTREVGVLGRDEPLHEHGDLPPLAQIGHVVPFEAGLEEPERVMAFALAPTRMCGDDRRDVLLGSGEAGSRLPVANPVHREVGGQHERGEPGLECLCDHLVADAAIAEDVDLEPARRSGSGGGDLGRRRSRHRRDAHERARGSCAACHRELPFLVCDLLERHGRNERRHRHGRTEQCRFRGHGRHVDEDARPQPEA